MAMPLNVLLHSLDPGALVAPAQARFEPVGVATDQVERDAA